MILIAHRGNTDGPKPKLENAPDYIDLALVRGFSCEIDLWVDGNDPDRDNLFLGHDKPQYEVDRLFLYDRCRSLYIHAKNRRAIEWLAHRREFNFFVHENDKFVLTSDGEVWCHSSDEVFTFGINVMPELHNINPEKLKGCFGVCSDFISRYK